MTSFLAQSRKAARLATTTSPKSERIEAEFRQELEHAIELIAERPDTWPRYLHGTRRFIMRRFPYAVVYRRNPTAVLMVVAIAHGSRKPGYWRHRTP